MAETTRHIEWIWDADGNLIGMNVTETMTTKEFLARYPGMAERVKTKEVTRG